MENGSLLIGKPKTTTKGVWMKIAIIPARGGSKRIPKKNIKPFNGKPIIIYPIIETLESKLFDHVIVSTDSEYIAKVALEAGAEVPFFRPSDLSDDITPTASVVAHGINWVNENWGRVEYACCVYPTSPFLRKEYLNKGYQLIVEKKVSSVFSVTSFPFSIFRALKINNHGFLEMFWPEYELTRSQDLPDSYHDAGQFYWLCAEKFLESGKLYANDSVPVILPRYLVQDIDTLEDWANAEYMYKALNIP